MTTDRKQVEEYIKDWANSETSPHFAVLIEGAWGCGKTHFVKGLIESKLPTLEKKPTGFLKQLISFESPTQKEKFTQKKKIYLSMFGLSNVADFERQLFYASVSTPTKLIHQGAGLVGSVFGATLNIGSGNVLSANLDGVFDGVSKEIQKFSKTLDDAVLILDDIERCKIPIQELLGVVNRFIEHGDTRVILLANANKLNKGGKEPSFKTLREKIVGHSFMLASDSKGAIDAFIKDINDVKVRAIIESHKDQICALHNTSGYDNLRALRQFIWHLRGILEKLDEVHRKDADLIERLVYQAFVFFMEFKLDLSVESAKLTPQSLWSKDHTNKDDARSVFEFSKNMHNSSKDKKEETPKYKILQKYDNLMHTVVGVKQWISILESGIIDKKWLNDEIVYHKELKWHEWPSWQRLWYFPDWDFSYPDSDKQFDADLQDVIDKISNGFYKDIWDFLHVAGILLGFAESGLYQKTIQDTIQDMKNYIDTYLIPNMTYEIHSRVSSRIDTGYKGLGFTRHDKPDFKGVRSYLIKKSNDWHNEWKKRDAGVELLSYMNKDLYQFLGAISFSNNRHEERFVKEAILHTLDPVKFVDAWFNLPRQDERFLTGSIKKRYSTNLGSPDILKLEAPWWESVKQELSKRQKAEKSKPRAIQIGGLIETVNSSILAQVENPITV